MQKTILTFAIGLACTASGWASIGEPYIGEEPIGWQTTNAVTATSGSRSSALPEDDKWPVIYTINGGAFEANGAPGSKVPFPGAQYTTDGLHHSYDVTGNAWRANSYYPTGLPHPSGRAAGGGVYSQNWLSYEFDKAYSITTIDIWNGAYCGGVGGPGDWSLRDVYIDYKINGVWEMAATTVRLTRVPDIFAWFLPNTVQANKVGVTQVVITPINSWAEDCSWDPPCTGGYLDPQACVSEVRFYTPAAPPSLSITTEGTAVKISWPGSMAGYKLESTPVLGPNANWAAVQGVENNTITIPSPGSSQFYRLTNQ